MSTSIPLYYSNCFNTSQSNVVMHLNKPGGGTSVDDVGKGFNYKILEENIYNKDINRHCKSKNQNSKPKYGSTCSICISEFEKVSDMNQNTLLTTTKKVI